METGSNGMLTRRFFMATAAPLALAGPIALMSTRAPANGSAARALAFEHTHTRQTLALVYAIGNHYLHEALQQLNQFLRDHYSGEIGNMDPRLFDQLYELKTILGTEQAFHVISGYRCAATNLQLRKRGGGGVAQHSLHMEGRAIDIRLPGVALVQARDAALCMKAGGVGFYPGEDFIHLDTGQVRRW